VNIRSGTGKEETDVGKEMRKIIAEFHVLFLFFFFLVRMLAPYGALLREKKRTSKLGRIKKKKGKEALSTTATGDFLCVYNEYEKRCVRKTCCPQTIRKSR
jgi:hypothetical protein